MRLFNRWRSQRAAPQPTPRPGPRLPGDMDTRKAARPVINSVRPGTAHATPRRYANLAAEGYRDNVIAYRAINLVANGAGALPVRLYRGETEMLQHPVLSLMQTCRNIGGPCNLLGGLVHHYLIAGNAYLLAVGPKGSAPKELWILRPDCVRIIEGSDGLPAGYEYRRASQTRRYAAEDILHWRSFNPLHDWYGMAPLEAAALSIDQHNDSGRWNLAMVQNGGVPSGVLYQDGDVEPLTEQQFSNLKKQIEDRHSGPDNAGRPMLLEGGLRWQDMGRSAKDLDWQAGMNMAARDIAMAFGVPSQLLGLPDSQTYSNYTEARQSLYEDTILPLARQVTEQLNTWLLPRFDNRLHLEIMTDEIPALEARRMRKYSALAGADFLSTAEKRRAVGLPDAAQPASPKRSKVDTSAS